MSDYRGMSYGQASREAERIIARDGWYRSWHKLAELREIMQHATLPDLRGRMEDRG